MQPTFNQYENFKKLLSSFISDEAYFNPIEGLINADSILSILNFHQAKKSDLDHFLHSHVDDSEFLFVGAQSHQILNFICSEFNLNRATQFDICIASIKVSPLEPEFYGSLTRLIDARPKFNWSRWFEDTMFVISDAINQSSEKKIHRRTLVKIGPSKTERINEALLSFVKLQLTLGVHENLLDRFGEKYHSWSTVLGENPTLDNLIEFYRDGKSFIDSFSLCGCFGDKDTIYESTVIVTVVYGQHFLEHFIELAKYNFSTNQESGSGSVSLKWLVVTDQNGKNYLEENEFVNTFLRQFISFETIVPPINFSEITRIFGNYFTSQSLYALALQMIGKMGMNGIILPPDVLLSCDWLSMINRKKINVCSGIRCNADRVLKELNCQDGTKISKTRLNTLRFNYLHSTLESTTLLAADTEISQIPTVLIQKHAQDIKSICTSQLHPLFVPRKVLKDFKSFMIPSLDGSFLSLICRQNEVSEFDKHIHVVNETEGPIMIELSHDTMDEAPYKKTSLLTDGVNWHYHNLSTINTFFLQKSFNQYSRGLPTSSSPTIIKDFIKFVSSLYSKEISNGPKRGLKRRKSTKKLVINLPLWGEEFIQKSSLFLFPTLFGDESLNFLRKHYEFIFLLQTDKHSLELISEALKQTSLLAFEWQIQQIFDDNFEVQKDKYSSLKYSRVTHAQELAIEFCKINRMDVLIPLYGDFIIPNTFFSVMSLHLESNCKIMLSLVPAVETEKVLQAYQSTIENNERKQFSNAEILTLIKECLHPLFYQSIDGYSGEFNPIGPYFGIGDKSGFAIKSFHYHPVFITIDPELNYKFSGTIDEHLIPKMDLNPLNTDFNQSGNLNIVSLMDRDFPAPNHQNLSQTYFYFSQLERAPNIQQAIFMLSATTTYDFEEKVTSKLTERLTNFVNYLTELYSIKNGNRLVIENSKLLNAQRQELFRNSLSKNWLSIFVRAVYVVPQKPRRLALRYLPTKLKVLLIKKMR